MSYVKYMPLGLLIAFCSKTIISGIDFASMGAILGLCALVGYIEYKENDKVIKDIKENMNIISNQNEILKKEVSEVKSYMNAARITDGLRNPLRKI